MKATQATDPIAEHGEGAFWDAVGQRLLIVDLLKGDILSLGETPSLGEPFTRHHVGVVRDRIAFDLVQDARGPLPPTTTILPSGEKATEPGSQPVCSTSSASVAPSPNNLIRVPI